MAAISPPVRTKSPSDTSSTRAGGQHAFVHTLETAAEQRHADAPRQAPREALVEARAARREIEHRPVGARQAGVGGVERRRDDIGAQHHAGAAAGRAVIDGAMAVGRLIADVARIEAPAALGQGAAGERDGERSGEHLRIKG